MDYDEEKYSAAKEFWLNMFRMFMPRDESAEEQDAFYDALADLFGEN